MTGGPCFKCGVNGWTSCQHRPAYMEKPKHIDEPDKVNKQVVFSGGGRYKMTSLYTGNGYNFRRRKRVR